MLLVMLHGYGRGVKEKGDYLLEDEGGISNLTSQRKTCE